VVHETLARTAEDGVDFDEVADRLAGMVAEVGSAAGEVRVRREGRFGVLEPEIATPLALVLVELVQNAAEHGVRDDGSDVLVSVRREPRRLRLAVVDRGHGLRAGFDATRDAGLGLQIVRTLVESELGGRLAVGEAEGGGTRAEVDVPVPERP
jgi:two-component sensor histidine kinase